MSTPFDETEAAAKLGHPGERFESIAPYMFDDVYWVVIGSGEQKIGRPVIVVRGHVVSDTGYSVGMAWLRRLAAAAKPDLKTEAVPQVLRWYDSLPIGWSENEIYDEQTNERTSVKLKPIEVKLVSSVYIPPRQRTAPSIPPGEPNPHAEGSLGRPPSGPSSGPSGGGPSGPSGGGPSGPSGGYSPPRPSRATLREVDGKLTWVLEAFDRSTNQWREELRDPAEN